MIYFWNGFKRMPDAQLEISLSKLEWCKANGKVAWEKETVDERAIYAVLKGVVLRHLKRTDEARASLQNDVLSHDRNIFKGGLKDNWTPPVAHYEMGVCYWVDYETDDNESDLDDAGAWLDKTAAWEAYDLDARVGLRVKTGQETIKRTKETRFGIL